jgi:hypothetical protein
MPHSPRSWAIFRCVTRFREIVLIARPLGLWVSRLLQRLRDPELHRHFDRGEDARSRQHPAVIVFDTFSSPPTIPIFRTVLINTANLVRLTVFCILMYG